MIDNRLLGSLLGKVMDSLNALDLVGKGGSSDLRCFAALMQARHGVATIQPLALSSSLLTMTGSGTVNLGGETLAMELRPQARLGGTAVVIPVSVAGPIRNPRVGMNKLGAAESNAGTVASAVLGSATPLGALGRPYRRQQADGRSGGCLSRRPGGGAGAGGPGRGSARGSAGARETAETRGPRCAAEESVQVIPVRVELDTQAWPPPSWRAKARHPRLCLHRQKAWMPTCVGMTGRRGRRIAVTTPIGMSSPP